MTLRSIKTHVAFVTSSCCLSLFINLFLEISFNDYHHICYSILYFKLKSRIQDNCSSYLKKMEEFSKKKGKTGTRGAQQIARENVETINFYRNMIHGANGIFFLMMTILGANYYSTEIAMFIGKNFIFYEVLCLTRSNLIDHS